MKSSILTIVFTAALLYSGTAQNKTVFPTKKNPEKYIEPKLVLVEGGQFIMGNNSRSETEEKPEHVVKVSSFRISKCEVTVAEFRKFMENSKYITNAEKDGLSYVWDGVSLIYAMKGVTWKDDVYGKKRVNEEDHPVIHVSRYDAEAYCKWLSEQTGKKYRLLTEAEWEYAAKGGKRHDKYIFSGGNDIDKVGWYAGNSEQRTHPVGKKKPNGLGIYDMSGNVWEWCSDWYGPYKSDTVTDPVGPASGDNGVLRGGAWRFYDTRTRCTTRRDTQPAFNGSGIGFRIACDLK